MTTVPATLRWERYAGAAAFARIAEGPASAAAGSATPFSTAYWLENWCKCFDQGRGKLSILVQRDAGSVRAVIPMVRSGRVLRVLRPPMNIHTPAWDVPPIARMAESAALSRERRRAAAKERAMLEIKTVQPLADDQDAPV